MDLETAAQELSQALYRVSPWGFEQDLERYDAAVKEFRAALAKRLELSTLVEESDDR